METAQCHNANGLVLILRLSASSLGVWEVEIAEPGGGRFDYQFETEAAARRVLETAYALGKKYGTWKITRAAGYEPADVGPH
jgi:hypothetical protein